MRSPRNSGGESPMSQAVFSAQRIAQLMAESADKVILPTEEQSTVIEQPLGHSVLVIAGAGSGKTETMANRVVWLVANGIVAPSQVLGLTFTRKAAGELAERIIVRLQQFAARLQLPEVRAKLSPIETERADELHQFMDEGLELPEVSTYNAFASSVVQEFGALAGVASTGALIDSASAWGLARRIVSESVDPELAETNDSISKIVGRVLNLDHAVSDHLTTFEAVVRHTEAVDRLSRLPYNEKRRDGQYAEIVEITENMRATRLTARLAQEYSAEKRGRGLIEFSDQLALAVETLKRSPKAVRVLRERTPVVLLDEVQDTSVAQTILLSTLFRESTVMAVGDPHQSIYGFRGASASNLRTFHHDFRGQASKPTQGVTLSLSTSWRNPSDVLELANVVSKPLAQRLNEESSMLSVKALTSRAQYLGIDEQGASSHIDLLACETIEEEFAGLAEWMLEARNTHLVEREKLPTAAVVVRSRAHMPAISAALWAKGVPNRIVGIGGLLGTPEVTDLVCALRCVWQADASNELIRLLSGARFRVGVSDLKGLSSAARWFGLRDHAKQEIPAIASHASLPHLDIDRQFTLLDALDEIAAMKSLDHVALAEISELGKQRLREAALMLRGLRQEVTNDLQALIRATLHALQLDIELDAAEQATHDGAAIARANLDSFAEQVDSFLMNDEEGTLSSLLAWIERATHFDEVEEYVPEPEPGTVQLITAHGSKGLEWDLVAVPRLVDGEFPANSREGAGWLRAGQLPDELRGDAKARPRLNLSLAETQQEAREAISAYKEALSEKHADEERRLAYVAITRAASRLLLSYSFWGAQVKPREPAVFLRELQQHRLLDGVQLQSAHESNPSERESRTITWPLDPLGSRKASVLAAADAVRQALAGREQPQFDEPEPHPVVELLLAERAIGHQRNRSAIESADRLTASTFHEFVEDPHGAERRRLRPMPMRPYRRTRTGNLFHEWVERRASTALGTSLMLDGLEESEYFDPQQSDGGGSPGEDAFESSEELDTLIESFERSRWADLQPIAVELELTMPFAGRTLVCKLDAVYQQGEGESATYEIVDWKSGKAPKTEAERESRFLQLDLYRQAYAAWSGVAPERIDVTLFYVAEQTELRGESFRSLEQLEEAWLAAAAEIRE